MNPLVFRLDMMQSLALAAVIVFAGHAIQRRVGFLNRYNIPAPVVGGLLFAIAALALRVRNVIHFQFDTTLQPPLMIAFFTTIGLGASLRLLKEGGPQVILFWALATFFAILQNVVGVLLTKPLGVHPFLGLLGGSITLTGGLGTGAAFGKLMEDQYAFAGAVGLAVAAATFGIVTGGLIGGPVSTALIRRWKPRHRNADVGPATVALAVTAESAGGDFDQEPKGEVPTAYRLLKVLTILLVAMWLGSLLSGWMGQYFTLPAYIGAMIVAGIMCNLAPALKLKIEQRVVEDLGMITLSLFLAMALMSLKLWELLDLAVPMLVILCTQVVLMVIFAYVVSFRVMGRDYDAAVMAGGLVGFALGATPNAVANMEAVTEKYGPAPRAFLVVPIVGAFLIDFTNALIITAFLNILG